MKCVYKWYRTDCSFSRLKFIVYLVFFSQIACQETRPRNSSSHLAREGNEHLNFLKNHRMNTDEVPSLLGVKQQEVDGHLMSNQNDLSFNVDFLEQPDQFEVGQSFFMPSRQVPHYKQVVQEAAPYHDHHRQPDQSASATSRWSIALNQQATERGAQREAIQIVQDGQTLQTQLAMTTEPASSQQLNQTSTSLIHFDDEQEVKNQSIARLTEELARLKEAERTLEKSLLDQRELIRPKLISEINKQLASESGHQGQSPPDYHQSNDIRDHNLVILHHSDDSMRGILPKSNSVQHPGRGTQKLKLKKLSSLLTLPTDNKKRPAKNLFAQPTTTLPAVQMNPNAREEPGAGVESSQDGNQFKRQMQTMITRPIATDNFQNLLKPNRKNDARFDGHSSQLFNNNNDEQYRAYLNYIKSLGKPRDVNAIKAPQKHWSTELDSMTGNKLQSGFTGTTLMDQDDTLITPNPFAQALSSMATNPPHLEEMDASLYDGDMKDLNDYLNDQNNRVPAASSHFEYSSHAYIPPDPIRFKTPASMPTEDHHYHQQWPSNTRPRRYPPPTRFMSHHHLSGSSGQHKLAPPPRLHRDYNHGHRMATGPSYHQRGYRIKPMMYESDEHLEPGGSHSHKVIHIHKEEKKKKYGKYLWPILGGGLTMLMGFLIISNMLLSIPLLAIGASSLFNHGGGFHSQQLVPIYNLSQLQPPRPSGRRRKRWATTSSADASNDDPFRVVKKIEPRELLKRVLFSLSRANKCRVAVF